MSKIAFSFSFSLAASTLFQIKLCEISYVVTHFFICIQENFTAIFNSGYFGRILNLKTLRFGFCWSLNTQKQNPSEMKLVLKFFFDNRYEDIKNTLLINEIGEKLRLNFISLDLFHVFLRTGFSWQSDQDSLF